MNLKFTIGLVLNITAVFLLGFSSFVAYSSVIPTAINSDFHVSCYRSNFEDVVSLVNKAEKLIEEIGPKLALQKFMHPGGGFIRGDLYIFVLNPNGVVIAHGNAPQSVGLSALEAQDKNGYFFVKDLLKKAYTEKSGWVQYHLPSPCTGKLSLKKVFFKRVGLFVVSAGYYDFLGK